MARFIALFLICIAFSAKVSCAYEFEQINRLFSYLETNYSESLNYEQLTHSAGKILHDFDPNIKLYQSDSKAFLYGEGNLIDTFSFPDENKPEAWYSVFHKILLSGYEHSQTIQNNPYAFEQKVLTMITEHLDVYSRIEVDAFSENLIDYTIKDNVLYLKATSFYHGSTQNMKEILLNYPDIDGLILDLRGNRGGYFDEAIQTADLFLDEVLITYSIEKNNPRRFYNSTKGDILLGKSIVILTDENTASAAEIVTAALSEQGRAVVIGTKTHGKGTIQQTYHFEDSTLYLTSGLFFSPSGKMIQDKGILPQICTGIHESCLFSNKSDRQKDVATAIQIIQARLS